MASVNTARKPMVSTKGLKSIKKNMRTEARTATSMMNST